MTIIVALMFCRFCKKEYGLISAWKISNQRGFKVETIWKQIPLNVKMCIISESHESLPKYNEQPVKRDICNFFRESVL